ncbi:MAG: DUF1116 domain-containing protein [Candidatus Eisenbacteria bacterium]
MSAGDLFKRELGVVNVGLRSFKESLDAVGATSVHVDWQPPMDVADGARRVVAEHSGAIERANAEAVGIILRGAPRLVGMGRALDVVPGMRERLFLHAGPPITWDRMCGPMRGAVMGGLIYEGLADSPEGAESLAASGEVEFEPCHEHSAVGPMAGVVTPSMPVFRVRNDAFGNDAFCTMNEGLGKVLRYGAFAPEVIEKLVWMRDVLHPTLEAALEASGPVDLKNLMAQALHMGDEVHNRNRAATSLLYRALAPAVVGTCDDREVASKVLAFVNGNDHFFLNLSMPACKATLDPARGVAGSSIVVAMTRNGTDFGIQLAGTGGDWFTGPADVPDALFFPGYSRDDANPDIGDSSITETAGLGGFAIAASPAIVQFVGGSTADAISYTREMYEITAAENDVYQIPYLDFRGTPTGIDVVKVVAKNILPFIDTGVAHREPGIGQVGAGVLRASSEPFARAFEGLADRLRGRKQR